MKKHHCHSNLEGSDFNGAFTYGVSAGARTRTEGVGGLYGIQFHYGHISISYYSHIEEPPHIV